jgi:hypothetical protein
MVDAFKGASIKILFPQKGKMFVNLMDSVLN